MRRGPNRRFHPETDECREPFYIDIGANHPTHLNNTYKFYLRGGNGILVEPNPMLAKLLKAKHPREKVIAKALELKGVDSIRLHLMNSHEFSTTDQSQAEKKSEHSFFQVREIINVPGISFAKLAEICGSSSLDFVSIDIESKMKPLILEIDFKLFRPKVLCIETKIYHPDGRAARDWEIIELFMSNDYTIYADTFLNTIFVERSWKGTHAASLASCFSSHRDSI